MRLEICLPIYNEAAILSQSVNQTFLFCEKNLSDYDWSIMLLINGSSDKSELITKELSTSHKQIQYRIYTEGGKGRTLRRYILESNAEILIYMDADLAVDLNDIPLLIKPIAENKADIAIGNRFHPNSVVERGLFREIQSNCYSYLSRFLFWQPFHDLQCGFKALRPAVFKDIAEKVKNPGWFFDTEFIVYAHKQNLRIAEVAINWKDARLGPRQSKTNILLGTPRFILQVLKFWFKLVFRA